MRYVSYIDTVGAVPPKVTADNLYDHGGLYFHTLFESLDGWYQDVSGSGSITLDYHGLDLDTGTTADSVARVCKSPSNPLNNLTWDKNRRLRLRVYISSIQTGADDVIWMVMGAYGSYQHVGFKILAGTLYGTVYDGTTENTLDIQTVAAGDSPLLEVIFTAGIEAEFLVDGVSKGTLTANLPTGTTYASHLLYLYLNNATTADSLKISISEAKFLQEE